MPYTGIHISNSTIGSVILLNAHSLHTVETCDLAARPMPPPPIHITSRHRNYANLTGRLGGGWGVRTPGHTLDGAAPDQNFRSTTDVLTLTVVKYSLHKCSEIILRRSNDSPSTCSQVPEFHWSKKKLPTGYFRSRPLESLAAETVSSSEGLIIWSACHCW